MKFEKWFPTVIAFEDDAEIDTNKLIDYTYSLVKKSDGRIYSNMGGWQSHDLDHSDIELQELFSYIQKKLDEYVIVSNWKIRAVLDNTWINVNLKDNYNCSHIHPRSVLSGVLYLKTPPNCGKIIFDNPNLNMISSYFDFNSRFNNDEVLSQSISYQPLANRIVVFPSWLRHTVEPNKSEHDRISVAFNSHYVKY